VSGEFGGYKREAEERMEELSGELNEWKEQAQMALSVVGFLNALCFLGGAPLGPCPLCCIGCCTC
jgi:hypothetical protein